VDRVLAKSPAEKAGIQRHDIILKAGEEDVEKISRLADVVKRSGGGPLKLQVLRGGKRVAIEVTPGKRSAPKLKRGENAEEGAWEPFRNDFSTYQYFNKGFLRPVKLPDLPADLTVVVTKRGKEPASIEVRRGKEVWTLNEGDYEKLPEDVRNNVKRYLAGEDTDTGKLSRWVLSNRLSQAAGPQDLLRNYGFRLGDKDSSRQAQDSGKLLNRVDQLSREIEGIRKELRNEERATSHQLGEG
jgi:C-terminal processing protease CtpA/Prc